MPDTGTSANRIGYARVSSVGQSLDSQTDALREAGCAKIFTDRMTGSRLDRPGWDQMMAYVRPGDTLVVTELSRMTRSLLDLLETAKALQQRRIELVLLRESIDTTTATGCCFLSITGAIHQMQGDLRAERAAAGRDSAKVRGKPGGRPRIGPTKLENARMLHEHSSKAAAEACAVAGVGRRTLFSYLAKLKKAHAGGSKDAL